MYCVPQNTLHMLQICTYVCAVRMCVQDLCDLKAAHTRTVHNIHFLDSTQR